MRLGLVIPSVGRPEVLTNALTAARRNAPGLSDLVVVARREDSATVAVAEAHGVRCVLVDEPGLAFAMRAGALECDSDIVAFSDDDAEIRPDWYDRLLDHYQSPDVGAVGGKDAQIDGDPSTVPDNRVGTVTRSGRVVGGHHAAVGVPRDVDHLKGANCSFRRDAFLAWNVQGIIAGSGAQSRNELVVCLGIKALGYRVIYDPLVQVDHYPAVRAKGDDRSGSDAKTYEAAFNESLAFELSQDDRRILNRVMLTVVGYPGCPGALRLLTGAKWTRVRATRRALSAARKEARNSRALLVDAVQKAGRPW